MQSRVLEGYRGGRSFLAAVEAIVAENNVTDVSLFVFPVEAHSSLEAIEVAIYSLPE